MVVVSKEPDIDWDIVVGEICHNFRSALDQLVWILSTNPHPKSGFPIYCSQTLYERGGREGAAIRLQGVPPAVKARIDRLQPFRAGGSKNPLWLLHELNRIDKHQTPVLALAELHLLQVHLLKPHDDIQVFDPPEFVHSGFAEVGTEIRRYRIVAKEPGSGDAQPVDAEVEFLFSGRIAFKDAGPASDLPAAETLRSMSSLTRKVVTNLSRFISS